MTKSANEICLIVDTIISAIFRYDIITIYKPFKKYDKFRIIEGAFYIFIFHMSFIEGFIHDRSKSWWRHELIYFARRVQGE